MCMQYLQKVFGVVLVGLCLFVWYPLLQAAEPEKPVVTTLTIIHINDVYRILPKGDRGGMAKLASVINTEKSKKEHVVVTHGGDAFSPSLLSSVDQGKHMVDMLNQVGVDLFAVGNHEFYFGPDVFKQRSDEAKFEILSTNMHDPGNTQPNVKGSVIRKAGPYKVGFISVANVTVMNEHTNIGSHLSYLPAMEVASKSAQSLREQGVDLVVLLAHTPLENDMKLLLTGDFDIILGADDHKLVVHRDSIPGPLYVQMQEDANYIAVIDVEMETVTSRGKDKFVWEPILTIVDTKRIAENSKIAVVVQSYEDNLNQMLGHKIGTTLVELDSRRTSVRGHETAIGNLFADASRAAVGAQIGLVNGGGIRGNTIYPANTELTRKWVMTELPFGNRNYLIEVTGKELQQALESSVSSYEKLPGRFMQVSGLNVVYNLAKPSGHRVIEISVNGHPLQLDKTYTLATNDYVAKGGDGYTMFKDAKRLIAPKDTVPLDQVVAQYIVDQHGEVAPKVEGRIILRK